MVCKVDDKYQIDYPRLAGTIKTAVRFLDDVIEVNKFPLPPIEEMTKKSRKIGLGVMGFADMLIMLGIPYYSEEALKTAGNVMKFIHEQSIDASAGLAGQRGVFENFDKSVYSKGGPTLRNATVNTIAPTGTISIIAGCSSGIEPLFAVSFIRNVLSGTKLFEVNPLFEEAAKKEGIYKEEILGEIARKGSVESVKGVPAALKRVFVTAFDVEPLQHLKVQAAFQKYTDNAVSKTINLSEDASVEDVREIYLKAYELKCKGITIYRYNSKEQQVLSFGGGRKDVSGPQREFMSAEAEYTGGCATGTCAF
jgi:ribonucleoside-diphosphate reductase alpha chain